ncbi:MAG: cyclic nucleotide-binding domain-containing protein [Spirochaetes bacterium]|nr:cyclic nucleotide-binding domain-containing protein [Spirochaetota bacterium]
MDNYKIKRNNLFSSIPESQLDLLDEYKFDIIHFKKDDILIEEDSISNGIFLILDGTVIIQKKLNDSEYLDIAKKTFPEYVGEMGLIDGSERSARVSCYSDCDIAFLSKENFFSIIDKFPQVKNTIAKNISSNLRELHQKTLNEYDRNMQLLDLNQKILSQNRELEELNQLKNNLIQMITHDLKHPLTIISGYAQLLEQKIKDQKESEMVFSIEVAVKQMLDMINLLLEATRIENREITFQPEKCNIVPFILEEISQFSLLAKAKNQEIKYTETFEKSFAYIDPEKFKRVIGNLLSNAIKYSPFNSKIYVFLEDVTMNNIDYVKIIIQDYGIGIPLEEQPKLFRKFEKLSTKPTGQESSTGLGLYIVKKFMEMHNGFYGVESEFKKGSKFYVLFPKII